MKVGVIGLGLMGEPIAERVLAAGHDLTVTSRRREAATELERLGARWAASTAECATGSDAVVLSLPDVVTVESVTLGPEGVVAARPGMVIDTSTSPPDLSRRIADACAVHGISALDAPVSGGPAGAREGTLSIMVGGRDADFESAEPLLRCFGTPRHIGPAGSGQSAKLVNQVLVATTTAGIAETWVLARNLGLDARMLYEVLADGIGAGRLLDFAWPRLMSSDMTPGFKIDHLIKDMRMSLGLGDTVGIDLEAVRSALRRYEELSENGSGSLGTQALARHRSLNSRNLDGE